MLLSVYLCLNCSKTVISFNALESEKLNKKNNFSACIIIIFF